MQQITPCLWFDTEGEEAARFYTSIFPNSRIVDTGYYTDAGPRPAGTVMIVTFELDGQRFTALNGGPEFTFSEAVSFQVSCADQAEVDRYWDALSAGGEEGPCGWLKDKYGVSWQIVPDLIARAARRRRPGALDAGDAGDSRDAEDRHRHARASRGAGLARASRSREPRRPPTGLRLGDPHRLRLVALDRRRRASAPPRRG